MDSTKDQPAVMSARGSKLRYPLRSAGKGRDGKPAGGDASGSSASRRGRDSASVTKSVSALDLSGKDRSVKPPRRLSIPSKSASTSPHPATVGSITPISEYRVKKPDSKGSIGTPSSDVSKTMNRKKFSVLSSVSYWLSQIKLSESASKHSISLGFFKLALESGCEPLQRVREELKSYAVRHYILELGEPARELLQSFNILQEVEDAQASQTDSHIPEDGTKSSDDFSSSSPTARSGNIKPKSINALVLGVAEATKKDVNQSKFPARMNRASYNRNPVNPSPVRDGNGSTNKKSHKPRNLDSNKDRAHAKTKTKKSATETVVPPPSEEAPHENKENMDHQLVEESNLTVEPQAS